MTHEELRTRHFERLNGYRHSAEFADYRRSIEGDVPPGPLPSLVGDRWEIDRDIYDEFLNILPPLGWRGGTFYLMEFSFGDITAKFTREGRYYCEHAPYPPRRAAVVPFADRVRDASDGVGPRRWPRSPAVTRSPVVGCRLSHRASKSAFSTRPARPRRSTRLPRKSFASRKATMRG